MADYDRFAQNYSDAMLEEGDYYHKTQIDPYIYKIIGNPKGKIIYDLGCGNGYISRNLAKKGAKMFASDISSELIKTAKGKSEGLGITYQVRDGIDFGEFKKNKFDFVVLNMVIHYIEDLDKLFRGVSKVLKKGGILVFSTSHFFRPDHPYSDWIKGDIDGKEKLFIKVTNYLESYFVKVKSWWDKKTELKIYNRPLNKFINIMSKYGLFVKEVYEPESVGFAKDFCEELQKSHHIPTFIIIGAIKLENDKIAS